MALKLIKKELKDFQNYPPANFWVASDDIDPFHWIVVMIGPDETPY
jgi:ubiquitin-protein ligase